MNIKQGLFALITLGGFALTSDLFAARRAMPSTGAPWPANRYDCFSYENGAVINVGTQAACGATINWDLPAHMDTTLTQNKHMTIYTNGNGDTGTTCWGVAMAANGSATIGASQTGQLAQWPNYSATSLDTPSVTVSSSHAFSVTCAIPAVVSGKYGRIATYKYYP